MLAVTGSTAGGVGKPPMDGIDFAGHPDITWLMRRIGLVTQGHVKDSGLLTRPDVPRSVEIGQSA